VTLPAEPPGTLATAILLSEMNATMINATHPVTDLPPTVLVAQENRFLCTHCLSGGRETFSDRREIIIRSEDFTLRTSGKMFGIKDLTNQCTSF
jgi:hypothetical protein